MFANDNKDSDACNSETQDSFSMMCEPNTQVQDSSFGDFVSTNPTVCVAESSTNPGNRTKSDIDVLSHKFDTVELVQKKEKCSIQHVHFELSNRTCIDMKGNRVWCRRPCIDVYKIYRQDEDGDTLLHIILIIPESELALYIIDHSPSSAWLNIKNKLSQTPLHIAVLTNQIAVVRRLVVGGADVEARDRHGNMAIHIASREGFLDVVRAVLQPVSYEEEQRNNYDVSFQNFYRTLYSVNYDGLTCLHIAATNNHIDVVKLLLASGANVNVKSEKSGRTILHEAAWSGDLELVKFLTTTQKTLDINAKAYDDYTAFDLARSRGHWSIVIELAKAGTKYEEEELEMA